MSANKKLKLTWASHHSKHVPYVTSLTPHNSLGVGTPITCILQTRKKEAEGHTARSARGRH